MIYLLCQSVRSEDGFLNTGDDLEITLPLDILGDFSTLAVDFNCDSVLHFI